jgi:hypothetical protein
MYAVRSLVTLSILVAALGCGGDSSTSLANVPLPGTYTLRTINRLPLPYTILAQDSVKVELMGDSFTLADDRSWSEFGTRRITFSGQVVTDTISVTGTYVLSGTRITLIAANGSTDGTIGGGTLTLTNDAVVAVYQK